MDMVLIAESGQVNMTMQVNMSTHEQLKIHHQTEWRAWRIKEEPLSLQAEQSCVVTT